MSDCYNRLKLPLLAEKKWAFGLIFFILFFNPLFYFWAGDVSMTDKCLSWVVCAVSGVAVSCIALFLKKRGEKIFLTVFFLLSAAPNVIVWSYLHLSDIYMRRDMFWVIFDSNITESAEFVQQFITWPFFLVGLVYAGAGLFFISKTKSGHALPIRKYPFLFALSILVILTDVSFQYLSQAIPTLEFYKSYLLFRREFYVFEKEKALRMKLTADVRCLLPDTTSGHTFVILLGESTATCHMGIYGYFRRTTPRMESRSSTLDIYTDVVTPDTHTYGVMQKTLTFASHSHPEYYREKASIVELFNAAGFETFWIANNPILDKWGASYGVIAQEAGQVFDVSLSKKPDGIVLNSLKKILDGSDGESSGKNKAIFIHLMGSHHTYHSRYPDEFDRFSHKRDGDLADMGFRDHKMKQTIDEYDNSILYGDFVYDLILRELEETGDSAWLLFFSDHGEEVFDTRAASGHHMSNVYPCQCRIPFILWRSEKYRAENPDIVVDPSRPYSTEDVIYSISTLSKLEYEGNNKTLSIFSPEYQAPVKRRVGKEEYESILKKSR